MLEWQIPVLRLTIAESLVSWNPVVWDVKSGPNSRHRTVEHMMVKAVQREVGREALQIVLSEFANEAGWLLQVWRGWSQVLLTPSLYREWRLMANASVNQLKQRGEPWDCKKRFVSGNSWYSRCGSESDLCHGIAFCKCLLRLSFMALVSDERQWIHDRQQWKRWRIVASNFLWRPNINLCHVSLHKIAK